MRAATEAYRHAVETGTCRADVGCGEPATFFDTSQARDEFDHSGVCQRCQDEEDFPDMALTVW